MAELPTHDGSIVSASGPTAPDPAAARESLAVAATARARARASASWQRRWLLVYAGCTVALLLAIGLGGRAGLIVGLGLWLPFVAAASVYLNRQGAVPPGSDRRIGITIAAWAVLYCAAVGVGLSAFPGDLAFWLPAAVAVASPMILGALLPTAGGTGR